VISIDREEHKRLCYCMLYYYVEMYKLPFPWRQLLLSGHQWTSEPGFGSCKSAPMEEQIAHISLFVSEISIFVLLCIYKKKTNVLKLLDRQMDRLIIPTHDSWGKERFSFPPGESRIRTNTRKCVKCVFRSAKIWYKMSHRTL